MVFVRALHISFINEHQNDIIHTYQAFHEHISFIQAVSFVSLIDKEGRSLVKCGQFQVHILLSLLEK